MAGKVNYVTVGTNNPTEAKKYYDALLSLAGFQPFMEHPRGGQIYASKTGGMFGVLVPESGQPATAGNGNMCALSFDSKAEVDAFYAKGVELGGSCAGAPGDRGPGMYFAYFRDPEGNKLSAYNIG